MDTFGIDERLNPPRIFLREEDRELGPGKVKGTRSFEREAFDRYESGCDVWVGQMLVSRPFRRAGKEAGAKKEGLHPSFGNGGRESPWLRRILHHFKEDGVDLTGKTDLLQLAAILERCQLLVTNDTGTMHVATAVGTPVVALFGPTDSVTTGPRGERGHRS